MKAFIMSLLLLVVSSALRAGDAPPELPLAVASFGAAAMPDGSLYFFGGHSGRRHKYNRDEVHGDLFRWKPETTGWEALAKDEPAQGASLVATAGGPVRIGGMAARNAPGEKQDLWSSDRAARYDIGTNQWIPLPALPQRRSSHDSIVCGGTLYVIGGWRMEGEADSVWHDTYLTLDLGKPDARWVSHPQPFKRRAIAVQSVDSKVYVIGGMRDDNELITDVSVLDTTTGKWSEGPSLPAEKNWGLWLCGRCS